MNWQDTILTMLSVLLTALVSWGAERLIKFINLTLAESKYKKYLTSAVDVTTRAVKTVYQTYVESLKNENMFTPEAQKEALTKAGALAMEQLSADTKSWLAANFGDEKEWISNTIESIIYDLKNINKTDSIDKKN